MPMESLYGQRRMERKLPIMVYASHDATTVSVIEREHEHALTERLYAVCVSFDSMVH